MTTRETRRLPPSALPPPKRVRLDSTTSALSVFASKPTLFHPPCPKSNDLIYVSDNVGDVAVDVDKDHLTYYPAEVSTYDPDTDIKRTHRQVIKNLENVSQDVRRTGKDGGDRFSKKPCRKTHCTTERDGDVPSDDDNDPDYFVEDEMQDMDEGEEDENDWQDENFDSDGE